MRRKTVFGTLLTLLLIGTLTLAFNIQPVKASGTIYVRGNGDVDPPTAPVQRDGDLYTLTDDIFSDTDGIVIERNNMTLDGAGHILRGSGAAFSRGVSLSGRSNVTIKDFEIEEFTEGIQFFTASNNSIYRNIVKNNNISISLSGGSHHNSINNNTISSNNYEGIVLLESDYNSITGNAIKKNGGDSGVKLDSASYNNITGNYVRNHSCGIWITSQFYDSIGNRICLNNFVDNTDQRSGVYLNNVWDNGTHGNFWSDYTGKDKDGDGVGDQRLPHLDVDYYPLMAIYSWYDITVESVTPSSTQVPIGTSTDIYVVVENQGGVTETFTVTTFANATVIGQTEVTLSSRDSTTITFTWDTTNFAMGNYTISAYATSVPGEIDTDDNGYIDGTVGVTYTATIEAYCYAGGGSISVSITMDGSPTGFTTPHVFTGLVDPHTFTVPKHSPEGYVFKRWSTSETSTTIAVDSSGTYTAYYEVCGPRLDTLYGHFIESPSAQQPFFTSGQVDIWPDIRDPVILRALEDDLYEVVLTLEAFLYYHIDFNVRDQVGNLTHIPCKDGTYAETWRNPEDGNYFTYQGGDYQGYVPLDDINFRHALAHCIPKDEIVATVYGGISGAAIDSLIPEAQRAWYTPGIDEHPLALGDPTATTVWDGNVPGVNHDACSILRYGGYVWESTAPNPAPKYTSSDPNGNWIDPHTGEPMNHITFAGVPQSIAPDSYGRDDMCYRDWRSIGLPIEHVQVDYGYLTDNMMDYYQYDMYALGWSIGRFPNHLYGFFHSSNNLCPEGYNIPGVDDSELDGYLDIIQRSKDVNEVKEAAADASARLAELCVSIPTVTRPLCLAAGKSTAPGFTDTVKGIVNSPGFGADTDLTYSGLYWESMVSGTNPLGIGGTMDYIVPSEPTNYHPAFASTTDEWLVMQNVVERLTNIDPYTHHDIPWLATSWTVEDWDYGGSEMGMKTTFWLRDDVYYHDGVQFDAYTAKFGLEWLQDMQIGRAQAMWQYLDHVEVINPFCFSVYHTVASLWTFYDIAGWASLIPPHIYDGTDIHFRPETTWNPLNPSLTCLIGTGPFMITDLDFSLGGYVEQTAYRVNPDLGITTHWWQTVEGYDDWLTTCFHWIGDGNSDGIIDVFDQTKAGKAFAANEGDPRYDAEADTAPELTYHTNDGRVDMRDIIEISKSWNRQRTYA